MSWIDPRLFLMTQIDDEQFDRRSWASRRNHRRRCLVLSADEQKGFGKLATDLRSIHVLNWGYYRDLLPEVSGTYWASLDEDFPNYHEHGG